MAAAAYQTSTSVAFLGLDCTICGLPAHGQHFGVLSCRPCAAFFRRCVVEKRTYKCTLGDNCCTTLLTNKDREGRPTCRACRFQLCEQSGMQYRARGDININNCDDLLMPDPGSKAADTVLLEHHFVRAHNQLVARLRALFQEMCSNRGEMVAPRNEVAVELFEKASRPFFLEMLDQALAESFAQLEQEIKPAALMSEECFQQLNLLNLCFLSIEHLTAVEDPRFFVAYGHVLNIDSLDETLRQWAMKADDPLEYLSGKKAAFNAKFAFIRKLKKLPFKVSQFDICAMFAATVCNKATCLSKEARERFREAILTEWLQQLNASLHSFQNATIQLGLLLSALARLELLCTPNNRASTSMMMHSQEHHQQQAVLPEVRNPTSDQMATELTSLTRIVCCYRRVWSAFHELTDSYLDKFGSLEQLLRSEENVLGMAECFSSNPRPLTWTERAQICSEMNYYAELAQHHPRMRKSIIVNRLLSVCVLKAIPAFRRLNIEEQACMVRQLRMPIWFLFTAYSSAQLGSKTLVGMDGIGSTELFGSVQRYRNDQCFMRLVEKTFCRCVEPFLQLPLPDEQEFAFLLGILCTHSSDSSVQSNASKELLYAAQVQHSAMLLRYQQMKLGSVEGAKRYAECLHLVESAFNSAHNHALFITYADTFHLKHFSNGFPKSISLLV